jgi:hypothetical protein
MDGGWLVLNSSPSSEAHTHISISLPGSAYKGRRDLETNPFIPFESASFATSPSPLTGLLTFPVPFKKLPDLLGVPGLGDPGKDCDWERDEEKGSADEEDEEALLLLLLGLVELEEEGPRREATRESISRREEGVPGGGWVV